MQRTYTNGFDQSTRTVGIRTASSAARAAAAPACSSTSMSSQAPSTKKTRTDSMATRLLPVTCDATANRSGPSMPPNFLNTLKSAASSHGAPGGADPLHSVIALTRVRRDGVLERSIWCSDRSLG